MSDTHLNGLIDNGIEEFKNQLQGICVLQFKQTNTKLHELVSQNFPVDAPIHHRYLAAMWMWHSDVVVCPVIIHPPSQTWFPQNMVGAMCVGTTLRKKIFFPEDHKDVTTCIANSAFKQNNCNQFKRVPTVELCCVFKVCNEINVQPTWVRNFPMNIWDH